MKWQTGSLCCQSRIVRIVEIWTHYPAGCLQGTFKIWQKGNSWFNFGRVVKTVKRICPTSIKRGDRLVDSSPPASRDIFHCQIFLQMSTSLTVHGKRSPIKKRSQALCSEVLKATQVGKYYVCVTWSAHFCPFFQLKLNLFNGQLLLDVKAVKKEATLHQLHIAVGFILHFNLHYIC